MESHHGNSNHGSFTVSLQLLRQRAGHIGHSSLAATAAGDMDLVTARPVPAVS